MAPIARRDVRRAPLRRDLSIAAGASACAGANAAAAGAFVVVTAARLPPLTRPLRRSEPAALIGELKAFAEALGGQPTENFLRFSERSTADDRCYLTGKLQLPEFYSGLRMIREDEGHCTARAAASDVFFYPVTGGRERPRNDHGLARRGTDDARPCRRAARGFSQPSLKPERRRPRWQKRRRPWSGFSRGASLPGKHSGKTRRPFACSVAMPILFLRKSFIVNLYYDKLSALFASFRSGALTQEETLAGKDRALSPARSCPARRFRQTLSRSTSVRRP